MKKKRNTITTYKIIALPFEQRMIEYAFFIVFLSSSIFADGLKSLVTIIIALLILPFLLTVKKEIKRKGD